MQLDDSAGSRVALEVTGYQFPNLRAHGEQDHDDLNWLRIRGRMTSGGTHWQFDDPCMTTHEVGGLERWLRNVASGAVAVASAISGAGLLEFLEPNITVEVASRSGTSVDLLWRFTLESAPAGSRDAKRVERGYPLRIAVTEEQLMRAADDLAADLARFPARP